MDANELIKKFAVAVKPFGEDGIYYLRLLRRLVKEASVENSVTYNMLLRWVVGGDTGSSSLAIWAAYMDVPEYESGFHGAVPWDPSDFGRCHRLLMLLPVPERKIALDKTAKAYPRWVPMVREWDKLTALFTAKDGSTGTEYPELYDLLHKLRRERGEAR
jgi:hypothetical protein